MEIKQPIVYKPCSNTEHWNNYLIWGHCEDCGAGDKKKKEKAILKLFIGNKK